MLINITGGEDMTLHEVSEASSIIQEAADPDANIIFGTVIDPKMQDKMKVTVIATGFRRPGVVARSPPSQHAGGHLELQATPRRWPSAPRSSTGEARTTCRWTWISTPTDSDDGNDLDVPTFLRRKS